MSEQPISEQQRVVGIVGSPREGGNTDVLVNEILQGAKASGAEVEVIALRDLTIEPCRACDACRERGECVLDDDFPTLLERMSASQAWVLGTPVYWWGPTAQFKAFLDRWYMANARRNIFHERRIAFAIPSGGGPSYANHTVGILEEVAAYLGMDHRGTLATAAGGLGDVRNQAETMERAREMGRLLVA